MTYTPGPWRVDSEPTNISGDREDEGWWFTLHAEADNNTFDEHIANARLMSAAPDLLEAAVEILNDFRPLEKRDNGKLSKLATAVALATGVLRRE